MNVHVDGAAWPWASRDSCRNLSAAVSCEVAGLVAASEVSRNGYFSVVVAVVAVACTDSDVAVYSVTAVKDAVVMVVVANIDLAVAAGQGLVYPAHTVLGALVEVVVRQKEAPENEMQQMDSGSIFSIQLV